MTDKSNVQRLADALRQVDDGEFISDGDDEIILDGRWETEPLEGALATAFAPEGIHFPLKEVEPNRLYLRTVWAKGTTASGREFEVSQSGVTLILEIGKFEGNDSKNRRVFEVPLENLVKAWLHSIGEK
jgi:hypothetical protein